MLGSAGTEQVTVAIVLGLKQSLCEASILLPSSAEVMYVWPYLSSTPYDFKERCLIKHRDNFTLSFLLSAH